eukprot:jgi/Botrbrau1/13413/Bobra.0082s0019.1
MAIPVVKLVAGLIYAYFSVCSATQVETPLIDFNFPDPFQAVLNGSIVTSLIGPWQGSLSLPNIFPASGSVGGPAQGPTTTCPPPGFSPVEPFDLESFISDYWYIQEQAILYFSPPETLFCESAHYVPINEFNERVPYRNDSVNYIDVRNYVNYGKVNGQPWGTSGSGGNTPLNFILGQVFYKEIATLKPGSSAIALPAFYPAGGIARSIIGSLGLTPLYQMPFGELWVVAAGPGKPGDANFKGYDWAILTSGAPQTPSNGACHGDNFGYWLFTREPLPSPDKITELKRIGAELGLDNTKLVKVQHEGCLYDQRT